MTTKRDGSVDAKREAAITLGQRMAAKVFAKRGNHSEVHIDHATLAALLAIAFEHGFDACHAMEAERP